MPASGSFVNHRLKAAPAQDPATTPAADPPAPGAGSGVRLPAFGLHAASKGKGKGKGAAAPASSEVHTMLINCSADTRLAAMTGATLSDHRARTAPQGVEASLSPAPASSEEMVWLDEAGGAAAAASTFGGGGGDDDDDSDTDSSTDSDV